MSRSKSRESRPRSRRRDKQRSAGSNMRSIARNFQTVADKVVVEPTFAPNIASTQVTALQSDVSQRDKQIQELQEKIRLLNGEITTHKASIQTCTDDLKQCNQDKTSHTATMSAKDTDITELKRQKAELEAKVQTMEVEKTTFQTQIANLQALQITESKRCETEKLAIQAVADQCETTKTELNTKIQVLETKNQDLLHQINAIAPTLNGCQSENAQIKAQLRKAIDEGKIDAALQAQMEPLVKIYNVVDAINLRLDTNGAQSVIPGDGKKWSPAAIWWSGADHKQWPNYDSLESDGTVLDGDAVDRFHLQLLKWTLLKKDLITKAIILQIGEFIEDFWASKKTFESSNTATLPKFTSQPVVTAAYVFIRSFISITDFVLHSNLSTIASLWQSILQLTTPLNDFTQSYLCLRIGLGWIPDFTSRRSLAMLDQREDSDRSCMNDVKWVFLVSTLRQAETLLLIDHQANSKRPIRMAKIGLDDTPHLRIDPEMKIQVPRQNCWIIFSQNFQNNPEWPDTLIKNWFEKLVYMWSTMYLTRSSAFPFFEQILATSLAKDNIFNVAYLLQLMVTVKSDYDWKTAHLDLDNIILQTDSSVITTYATISAAFLHVILTDPILSPNAKTHLKLILEKGKDEGSPNVKQISENLLSAHFTPSG